MVERTTAPLGVEPVAMRRYHASGVHPAINIERSIDTFMDFEAGAICAQHDRDKQRAFEMLLRTIATEILHDIVGGRRSNTGVEFRTHFELLDGDGVTMDKLLLPDRWQELVRRFLAQFDIAVEFHPAVRRPAPLELREHQGIRAIAYHSATIRDARR